MCRHAVCGAATWTWRIPDVRGLSWKGALSVRHLRVAASKGDPKAAGSEANWNTWAASRFRLRRFVTHVERNGLDGFRELSGESLPCSSGGPECSLWREIQRPGNASTLSCRKLRVMHVVMCWSDRVVSRRKENIRATSMRTSTSPERQREPSLEPQSPARQ